MIDWDRVKELRSDVGEEDFAEVMELFLEEITDAFDRLSQSASGDIAEDIHFIKGSALNIGLVEVSNLCKSAESRLREVPEARIDLRPLQLAFSQSKAGFNAARLE